MNKSAVSIVEQGGFVLCVWNQRFNGWTLPGGKVEVGESIEECQARELMEETDMCTRLAVLVYRGEHTHKLGTFMVSVFEVEAFGEPRGVEINCPVTWMTREDLIRQSPFGDFYQRFIGKQGVQHGTSSPPPAP